MVWPYSNCVVGFCEMFHHSKAWFIQIGVPKPGGNLKRRLPLTGRIILLKKTPLLQAWRKSPRPSGLKKTPLLLLDASYYFHVHTDRLLAFHSSQLVQVKICEVPWDVSSIDIDIFHLLIWAPTILGPNPRRLNSSRSELTGEDL